jgi:hypothetical protein
VLPSTKPRNPEAGGDGFDWYVCPYAVTEEGPPEVPDAIWLGHDGTPRPGSPPFRMSPFRQLTKWRRHLLELWGAGACDVYSYSTEQGVVKSQSCSANGDRSVQTTCHGGKKGFGEAPSGNKQKVLNRFVQVQVGRVLPDARVDRGECGTIRCDFGDGW